MNVLGAVILTAVVTIIYVGCVFEAGFRQDELETHKIAVQLQFDGNYVKRVYADEFYVGTGKNADVRIPYKAAGISALHAYIYREGPFFHIQNLDSQQSLYVRHINNIVKVAPNQSTELRNGSEVQIGDCLMTFKRGV